MVKRFTNRIGMDEAVEKFAKDGTSKRVRHDGRIVGREARLSQSDTKVFFWAQKPFRMESTPTKIAYGMEETVVNKLEDRGVETVLILDCGQFFDFDRLKEGDIISPLDNRFAEPKDDIQRVVRIDRI